MPRLLCPSCQLPPARCHCDYVVKQSCDLQLIIWQHPTEADHPKNSVRLLAACLPQIDIVCAEQLTPDELAAHVGRDLDALELLFPDTGTNSNAGNAARAHRQPTTQLLAIDGTWRKARKILHLNPWLNQLPRYPLDIQRPSRYHIRKAEQQDQLSTLEAICTAIEQIEGHSHTSGPILEAFDQYLTKLSFHRPN